VETVKMTLTIEVDVADDPTTDVDTLMNDIMPSGVDAEAPKVTVDVAGYRFFGTTRGIGRR
jgi:hypothetical protein